MLGEDQNTERQFTQSKQSRVIGKAVTQPFRRHHGTGRRKKKNDMTDKDSIETNLVNSAKSNTRGMQEEKAERNQLICNSSVRPKYSKTNRRTGDREAPSKPRLRM